MHSRQLIFLGCSLVLTGSLYSQSRADDMPWAASVAKPILPAAETRTMLTEFVERGLKPIPLPATRAEWDRRRGKIRDRVLRALGIEDRVPPRWPLKIRRLGAIEYKRYRIEKFTYESYPGMAVPALLYVPRRTTGKVPGIVSIAGHAYGSGKTSDFLQRRNVNLVLRGCVVLSYDYLNTGERNTGPNAKKNMPYGGGNDHFIRRFSFTRRNPTGLEVLDAIRAVDVLVGRWEVDRGRIGFTGESGGGNSTYWAGAVDSRIKLVIPVSSVTTFDYWIRKNRNYDWHQRPFGVRRHAGIGTLLALHAPRPLLVISSKRRTDDHEFPWEEAELSYRRARHVYGLVGARSAIAHYESPTAHGYQVDKRKQLYRWVDRWLQPPRSMGDRDLEVQVEPGERLEVGVKKLVPDNLTHLDIYNRWIGPLPRMTVDEVARSPKPARQWLASRLGWPKGESPPTLTVVGSEKGPSWTVTRGRFSTESGIVLPAVVVEKSTADDPQVGAPVGLVVGRSAKLISRALKECRKVVAVSPRGTGETKPGDGVLNNWGWFVGRPLAGQRAWDIARTAEWARSGSQEQKRTGIPVKIYADRDHWEAALLAAAMKPELFSGGEIRLGVASYQDLLKKPQDVGPAAVPGLLEQLDVPHLSRMAGSVKVVSPR